MPIFKLQPEMMLGQTKESLPQVDNGELKPGVFGNLETVELMKKIANHYKGHPKIRGMALAIFSTHQIPSQHHLTEAQKIGEFVQSRIRYVRDCDGIEQLHDPLTLIDQIERGVAQADCDDQALLLITLLLSVGIRPFLRAVRYRDKRGSYNHIYVVVYERNGRDIKKRLVLDPIIKDQPIGYEVPHMSGKEFGVWE